MFVLPFASSAYFFHFISVAFFFFFNCYLLSRLISLLLVPCIWSMVGIYLGSFIRDWEFYFDFIFWDCYLLRLEALSFKWLKLSYMEDWPSGFYSFRHKRKTFFLAAHDFIFGCWSFVLGAFCYVGWIAKIGAWNFFFVKWPLYLFGSWLEWTNLLVPGLAQMSAFQMGYHSSDHNITFFLCFLVYESFCRLAPCSKILLYNAQLVKLVWGNHEFGSFRCLKHNLEVKCNPPYL